MAAATLSGCGAAAGPTPLGIELEGPTTLVLWTDCARDIEVDVAESRSSVVVDDVRGVVIDGDCAGNVEIHLARPLGTRRIEVQGDQWVRVEASCPYGEVGPGDIDLCRAADVRP